MRRFHIIGFSVLLLPLLAQAQSPFDGTWKLVPNSLKPPKTPHVFLLQNGMYECKSCDPRISIKSDGTDQNVPYSETMSVKVIDDYNVEVKTKSEGKVVRTEEDSISANGDTLSVSITSSGCGSGHYTAKRVAKGPSGANLLSGSWRVLKKGLEVDAMTQTYKINGTELTMTNCVGQSYTAKLDGTDAPYKDDPDKATVSLKMLGKNTLEETTKIEGKIVRISKMKIASDGKSMKIAVDDKIDGTRTRATCMKQ